MTDRSRLLESIATIIVDYREGQLAAPTPDHVDRWVHQFGDDVQLPLLRELDHVLAKTYFRRENVARFLGNLATNQKLAGASPCEFWKRATFLDIQKKGNSQREMLAIFGEHLQEQCLFTMDACGRPGGDFIYIDDVMFSGSRVGNDLEAWILGDAPAQGVVHVIVIAVHTSGEWLAGNRLKKAIAASGKKIEIKYWRAATIENRKTYNRDSEVLWPAELPENQALASYIALPQKFPFEARPAGGKLGPFSSEAGRRLLERELLLAGVRIRAACASPKDVMRPLGFGPFGLGFGSMIVTFRNCPNNCPLALWWGDPEAAPNHPFSKWYPLVARKTYVDEVSIDDIPF